MNTILITDKFDEDDIKAALVALNDGQPMLSEQEIKLRHNLDPQNIQHTEPIKDDK